MNIIAEFANRIIDVLMPNLERYNKQEEAYLSQAVDLADLERRMKILQNPESNRYRY